MLKGGDIIYNSDDKEFSKYYNLYQKAFALEKDKKPNEALKIYLYILEKFVPGGSAYYERPIILLTKLKDYKTAVKVCDLAIKNQVKFKFHFPKEEFELRKNKLLKKLK